MAFWASVAVCTVVAGLSVIMESPAGASGPRTVTVTSSQNPSTVGDQVTFTATVSPSLGGGTMAFLESAGSTAHNYDQTVCPPQPLTRVDGDWGARCTASLRSGANPIEALYESSGGFRSAGFVMEEMDKHVATTTTVSSSLNPSRSGQDVVFTAVITPADGGAVRGVVTFKAEGTPIAGCTDQPVTFAGSTDQATCATSSLRIGPSKVKAVYGSAPSHEFFGSTATLEQVVKPARTQRPANGNCHFVAGPRLPRRDRDVHRHRVPLDRRRRYDVLAQWLPGRGSLRRGSSDRGRPRHLGRRL